MADRTIKIRINGGIPDKVICPSCNSEVVVPEQLDGKLAYQVVLTCSCHKNIFLECRL